MIEIGLCSDENYAMACGVCITSIFESNKNSKFRVHILTNGFTDSTIQRFEQTAKKYDQIVEIKTIDMTDIADLYINPKRHVSIMAYARLLFPRLLDNSIERLLYLDCDIVVIGDLSELWNEEFDNFGCIAVTDMNADDIFHHNRMDTFNHTFINSGVLVMNLSKWREDKLGEKCISRVQNFPPNNRMHDQDAINAELCDEIKLAHFKYNFTVPTFYGDITKLRLHKKWWSSLEEARENPIIIHYVYKIKPWHKEFKHKSKEYFMKALKSSQWNDYKISHKYKGRKRIKYQILTVARILRDRLSVQ